MKISVCGTGRMGSSIAERLMSVGHDVGVWNRNAAKTKSLVDAGAGLHGSPAALVERAGFAETGGPDGDGIERVAPGLQEPGARRTSVVGEGGERRRGRRRVTHDRITGRRLVDHVERE